MNYSKLATLFDGTTVIFIQFLQIHSYGSLTYEHVMLSHIIILFWVVFTYVAIFSLNFTLMMTIFNVAI